MALSQVQRAEQLAKAYSLARRMKTSQPDTDPSDVSTPDDVTTNEPSPFKLPEPQNLGAPRPAPLTRPQLQTELHENFMQRLREPPTAELPPSEQQPTAKPQPGGLPLPPSPREVGRTQLESLRRQAAEQIVNPVRSPEQMSPQQLASQGPTIAAAPSKLDRFFADYIRPVGRTVTSMLSPIDEETGMPNVDVANLPVSAVGKLARESQVAEDVAKAVPRELQQSTGGLFHRPPTATHVPESISTTPLPPHVTPPKPPAGVPPSGILPPSGPPSGLPPTQPPAPLPKLFEYSPGVSVRTQFIDKLSPLYDLTKHPPQALPTSADPYVAARNYAGHFGKTENRLDDLEKLVSPVGKYLKEFKEHALLERYTELAARGIDKFPGGMTAQDILARKQALEATLPPNALKAVRDAEDGVYKFSDQLLKEAKDAGIFSDAQYSAITQSNQKYVPLYRLEYIADQLEKLPSGGNSLSVGKQNIIQEIKGSEKDVLDPLESLVYKTYKTVNLIERNKVARRLYDLSSNPEFAGVVTQVKSGQRIPRGYDTVSALIDGKKHDVIVPELVAESVKGLNREHVDFITKMASTSASMLRAGATTLNLGFIPRNLLRDVQTATVTSEVGFTPLDFVQGLASYLKKDADFRAFRESGAAFSGYFERTKSMAGRFRKLERKVDPIYHTWKVVKSPKELTRTVVDAITAPIKGLGEAAEMSTRVGVYKRAARRGLTQEGAAFASRNATVDFAKSGSAVQIANMWLPFLNANIQGRANVVSALRGRLGKTALMLSTIVGAPAVLTYLHNTENFPKVWDQIAQFEKDNNFLIVYGDDVDDDGNPTQVVAIPKGDFGRLFSNPIEEFLNQIQKSDPKRLKALAYETLGEVSPIQITREGQFDEGRAIGSILPPAVRGIVEGRFNTNLYTGRPIVPRRMEGAAPAEQYHHDTPAWLVTLGKYMGISPLKLMNFIGTQFGGVGRQLADPARALESVSGGLGSVHGKQAEREDFKTLEQMQQDHDTARVIADRKAREIMSAVERLPAQARGQVLRGLVQAGKLDVDTLRAFTGLVEQKALGRSTFENILTGSPADVRAGIIVQKLEKLVPEDRVKMWQDLQSKGVITDAVVDEIAKRVGQR